MTQITLAQIMSEDPFWTLPYYCNAPESYMQQKVGELIIKILKEEERIPTIPVSQAIQLIEEVLPNHIVQRSWSLGPQRMCQELNRVVYRLRNMQSNVSNLKQTEGQ